MLSLLNCIYAYCYLLLFIILKDNKKIVIQLINLEICYFLYRKAVMSQNGDDAEVSDEFL